MCPHGRFQTTSTFTGSGSYRFNNTIWLFRYYYSWSSLSSMLLIGRERSYWVGDASQKHSENRNPVSWWLWVGLEMSSHALLLGKCGGSLRLTNLISKVEIKVGGLRLARGRSGRRIGTVQSFEDEAMSESPGDCWGAICSGRNAGMGSRGYYKPPFDLNTWINY